MHRWPRSLDAPLRLAIAAAIVLVGGCATNQHHAGEAGAAATPAVAPATAVMADSPTPASEVVQSADFTAKAAREGYHMMVRNGVVYYCYREFPMNSRIPRTYCLNETGIKLRLQAQERAREAMQRAAAAPNCTMAATC